MNSNFITREFFVIYATKFFNKFNPKYIEKFKNLDDLINKYVENLNIEIFNKYKNERFSDIFEKFNIKDIPSNITIHSYQRTIMKKVIEDWNTILNEIDYRRYIEVFPIDDKKLVFLSYAYDDKLIVCVLFMFFYERGIYLYVDFMHHNKLPCICCKNSLRSAINKCEQFLFLKTTQSEVYAIPASGRPFYSIRQWCAWEMGVFYSRCNCNGNEKFYISNTKNRNDFLLSLRKFKKIDSNNRLSDV